MRIRLTEGARDQWGVSGPAPGGVYNATSKEMPDDGETWYCFYDSQFHMFFWANDKMLEVID